MGCASSCQTEEPGRRRNPNRFRNTALSITYPLSSKYDPNVLLEWESAHKTEKYHWWPILDKDTGQEDYINNLFARGGGIDKYDRLCGTQALEYQKRHHRIPMDSNRKDKYWAGFCDKAATLSCLYKYPQKHVTAYFNGKTIEFSPRDIEALLICVCENSIRRGLTVFYGSRNNHSDEKLKGLEVVFMIAKGRRQFNFESSIAAVVALQSMVEILTAQKIPIKVKGYSVRFHIK